MIVHRYNYQKNKREANITDSVIISNSGQNVDGKALFNNPAAIIVSNWFIDDRLQPSSGFESRLNKDIVFCGLIRT